MSPVVQEITVRIMPVLMIMAIWQTEIIDVKGAFLKASFDPKHKVYMEIPKGFKKFYPKNVLLLLKKTLYGVNGILRIVTTPIKIDYSKLGWEDCDFLIMNQSRDNLLSCILSLWTPKIILGSSGAIILPCHPKWQPKYLTIQRDIVWLC